MSDTKNTLFTIGEFANLHSINKKTLMWYDEVDLFKPAVIKENGYRYYTYFQSATLETILMLRELDVPIGEIKKFMENKSAVNLKNLMEDRVAALDENIAYLKSIRKILVRRKSEISSLLSVDLSEITIVEKEKQYLAVVRTEKDSPLEKEIGMMFDEVKKQKQHRLRDISYGSMIPVESLVRGDFDDYFALFMKLPIQTPGKGFHTRPAGKYLRAFCRGSWDQIPSKYEEMLLFAKRHHMTLSGYAYETGINETVVNTMDEYITQIEILILD